MGRLATKPKPKLVSRANGNIHVDASCGFVEMRIGGSKPQTVTLSPGQARQLADALRVFAKH